MSTRFHHQAIFYADEDEYLAGTVPDIRSALGAGGAVLVAVGDDKARLLSGSLGADAASVQFVDMEAVGRNPACIIPVWRDFVRDNRAPLVGVGEPVWPGRSEAELAECRRHESLLNVAFDDGDGWRLLCPYDARALDPAVLAHARHNHPHLCEQGAIQPSSDYTEAADLLADDGALPPPAARPAVLAFTAEDLPLVRGFVTEHAQQAGLAPARTADLVLAAHELATNAIQHGGGNGVLRVWAQDGSLLVDVVDGGHIEDPLVGRERPPALDAGGRGLWLVNHLCDLVQVRSNHAGNVVRLHMTV